MNPSSPLGAGGELFAQFYLDEDVDVVLADMLRGREVRATTTHDAGNLGASDQAQLAYAVAGSMVLLTHNREDYRALHMAYRAAGKEHWGIVAVYPEAASCGCSGLVASDQSPLG